MKVIPIRADWLDERPDSDRILDNIATAGRVCYQSESTIKSADFVRRLIAHGHESVLEHEKVSVVVRCDRGVSHEYVRHRVASYSQESTRYCNYSHEKLGGGITYIDIMNGIRLCPVTSKLDPETIEAIFYEWWEACNDAERHYLKMLELGASPQIARSVLNNSTKTQLVVTMNLREWRHFFSLRCDYTAHPQMRELAIMLLYKFHDAIPVIFDDLAEEFSDAGQM